MNLQNLVKLVSSRTANDPGLIADLLKRQRFGKLEKLYYGISEGKYPNENYAALDLYQCDTKDKRYIKLRSRLRKLLLSVIPHFDYSTDQFPINWQKEFQCMKALFQAKVLIREGDRTNGIELLEKVENDAREIQLTPILIECYSFLRNNSALYGGLSEFGSNVSKLEEQLKIQGKEILIANIFHDCQVNTIKSVQNRIRFLPRFKEYKDLAASIANEYRTPTILNYNFLIQTSYNNFNNDYEANISFCDHLEELLAHETALKLTFKVSEINIVKAHALLRIGNYNEGLKYCEETISNFVLESPKWFFMMENYFLLAMKSGQYDLATAIFKQVNPFRMNIKLNMLARERWHIFATYLYLFTDDKEMRMNLNFLLQNTPKYSKDKLGYNVSLTILQFLYMLKTGDLEQAEYRLETLRKYVGNIGRSVENTRLRTIVSMLVSLYNSNLNTERARRACLRNYNKLKKTPPLNDTFTEMEVVNYDKIWELAMHLLNVKANA